MFPKQQDTYMIIVIEDIAKSIIVGAGSLIVERKFIRDCGLCGHIEDIVVHQEYEGRRFGSRIVNLLKELATMKDCYKIILDCAEHLVPFYAKVGFAVKGTQMAWYKSQDKTDMMPKRGPPAKK